ncbi:MAG: hypothetical protein IJ949_01440 [Oscillospiraceae bacterium]|nr:hypothetical protein [Oscillospiraceae bacterium]
MKSVLISIQPYWVFLIIAKTMGWNIGSEKTIEVRKNFPKDENWNKDVKIYCSKDKKSFAKIPKEYQPFMEKFLGKVIGEFVCDTFEHYTSNCTVFESVLLPSPNDLAEMCLNLEEFNSYGTKGKLLYGWHISNLIIYHKPKELSEFKKINRECWYADLGLAKRDCPECQNKGCFVQRPPQSWCYVEGGGSDA